MSSPVHTTTTELSEPATRLLGLLESRELDAARQLLDETPPDAWLPPKHSTPPRVDIRLLGACTVMVAGHEVPREQWHGRRQARLLLAALVLADGGAIRREQIAETIWPGLPHERISARLAPLVHALRRVLAAQRSAADGVRYLECSRGSMRLRLAPNDTCDVLQLRAHALAARRAHGSADIVDRALTALDHHGGQLLAGEGFDLALEPARQEIVRLVTEVAMLGARHVERARDMQRLAAVLRRLLADDPVREDIACALMQMHARAGNRSGVSHVFHDLRAALSSGVGIPPSPTTRTLYTSLIGSVAEAVCT